MAGAWITSSNRDNLETSGRASSSLFEWTIPVERGASKINRDRAAAFSPSPLFYTLPDCIFSCVIGVCATAGKLKKELPEGCIKFSTVLLKPSPSCYVMTRCCKDNTSTDLNSAVVTPVIHETYELPG